MKVTCHSEYHPLKSVFLKPVVSAFLSDEELASQWQKLNYLSQPDYNVALTEYEQFKELLLAQTKEIQLFEEDHQTSIDSIYCRDASIATDFGMILCNMGKDARNHEPQSHSEGFIQNKMPILGSIVSPGTLEGGDVAWLDEKTLAVGRTYRTNQQGIDQLKQLLEPKGVEIITVNLPHYKGPNDVFHLMSILSPVDKNLAVVYSPLMPIRFRENLLSRGFEFVEVPDDEFESMGCNVLAVAPRKCLMVDGNPQTKARLEEKGCQVTTYKGEEISVKGGGGPTCLTRPIERFL